MASSFLPILFTVTALCATPSMVGALPVNSLIELDGDLFLNLNEQINDANRFGQGDLLSKLKLHANGIANKEKDRIRDLNEQPWNNEKSRTKRDEPSAEETLEELKEVTYSIQAITKVYSIPVNYPNDVEVVYSNDDFYIVITDASNSSNPTYHDSVQIYKYDKETQTPTFVLSQYAPGVQDVEYFFTDYELVVMVAQLGEGTEFTEGITLYIWNIEDPVESQELSFIQHVYARQPSIVETVYGGGVQFIVVAQKTGEDFEDTAVMYEWIGSSIDEFASFPKPNLAGIIPFCIHSRVFVGLVSSQDKDGNPTTESEILLYNLHLHRFDSFQEITTHGAVDLAIFDFGSGLDLESFLLVANTYSERDEKIPKSIIYKYNKDRFVPFQCFEVSNIRGWHTIQTDKSLISLVVYTSSGIKIYEYNGWIFEEAAVQFEPYDIAIPVTAISSNYANGFADFAVASDNEQNETLCNFFVLEFASKSLAAEFEQEAGVQCVDQEIRLRNITQQQQVVESKLDKLIFKDLGNFTFSSNLTFLGAFDTSVIVTNDIQVESDQVLTNAEEEQLNRIIATIGRNTNALNVMESELPDTLLLDTTAQTATGQKTINTFSAEGDVSSTTLTVATDVVNTNVNIQDLEDQYIDRTADEIIDVTLTVSGGIDVEGDLDVGGLLDGVDMYEVVTLSGDHTITGVKTFSVGVTASGNFDVTGTVDGVSLTSSTVLRTTGAQTVTGLLTFAATVTSNEDIGVTGTVDGVDLSELYDEAVFLDGNHVISGPMTLSGPVSMDGGLVVTAGNTVDGVDIEQLDSDILRLSVEQDVTAEYTFTSPLAVSGDITVTESVDGVYIPQEVVLIDDPSECNLVGPVVFAVDVTVADLCVRDSINNINAPDSYESLDLLLTSPLTSKNQQTVTGTITFNTDIAIQTNSRFDGLVDGYDLQALYSNTVYTTGAQTISSPKTFSDDVTIDGTLTVERRINGVDIMALNDNAIKLSSGSINALGAITFSGPVTFESTVASGGAHTFGTSTTISDLVTQGTTENIAGAKTFSSITSSDNVQVTSEINSVPINTLYADAILLDAASSYTVTESWQFNEDVLVGGDLYTTGTIDGINLDEAVTISGDQTITGPTSFTSSLSASVVIEIDGDLGLSGTLNTYDVQTVNTDTLKCSGNQEVTGRKAFQTLTLQDDLVITGTVSGVDVSDINDDAVFITGNQVIGGQITFTSATTFQDVNFNDAVEDIAVPDFFFQVLTQDTTQTVVGALDTMSDVRVDADIDVTSTVNGLVIEDMWSYSAKTTDSTYSVSLSFVDVDSEADIVVGGTVDGIVISRDVALADKAYQVFTGQKSFQTAPVFDADVSVGLVNGVDILDLWQNAVKNVGDQDITQGKTFDNGFTINGDLAVTGTVDGVDVLDLSNRAVVTSDIGGAVQTITADVRFTDVTAEDDITYTGLLQTVNIQTLDSSYFSRTAPSQTITADKQFTGPVTVVTGGTLDVDRLILLGVLNGNDLDQLHQDVWTNNRSDIIYDTKTFTQCVTINGNLVVDGTINDVDISGNVMVTNADQLVTSFKKFTSDLTIQGQNLNFEATVKIDGVDVSDWSQSAARKNSPYTVTPHITFDDVVAQGDITVSGDCNSVDFSPATYMTISRNQDVTAIKTFEFGVVFSGNMDVTGTVQGADVVVIETTSLLTSGAQTLEGGLTFQAVPTFSDITTTALIDGEDVVELYLRIHNTPALGDFDDFVEGQCDLLDDMHDAFEDQAYILRYPEEVQIFETIGRAKWEGFFFDGIQWLVQAKSEIIMVNSEAPCLTSIIYQWSDGDGRYNQYKTLTLDFAEDIAFFAEEGFMFLAVITTSSLRGCEVINDLPGDALPARSPDFEGNVVPDAFTANYDHYVLIYVWSPALDDFYVYQRLAGVGSVSVDHYIDPILDKSCLAVANHRSNENGEWLTDVDSAVFCMDSVAQGFNHIALLDTLGAVKIHPFVYDDVLHLAVANRLDSAQRTFLVESAIWGNFVKEVVIPTTAAADVAVHKFHDQYFVAFANEFEGHLGQVDYETPITIYSYTYDAGGQSVVDLQQEIPAFRTQSLEFFEVYDQLFLVVVNRTNTVNIFRYYGMELFHMIHTIPLAGAANIAVYPFKNDPENIHIAAMSYEELPAVAVGAPITPVIVTSKILSLFFQGFEPDTMGCSGN